MNNDSEKSQDTDELLKGPIAPGILGMTRLTIVLAIMGIGLSSAVMLMYSMITLVKATMNAFRESQYTIGACNIWPWN